MKVALVEWIDAAVIAGTWRDRQDAIAAAPDILTQPIVSAGLVIRDEPDGILLAVSLNREVDDIQGGILIPRDAVRSFIEVADVPDKA